MDSSSEKLPSPLVYAHRQSVLGMLFGDQECKAELLKVVKPFVNNLYAKANNPQGNIYELFLNCFVKSGCLLYNELVAGALKAREQRAADAEKKRLEADAEDAEADDDDEEDGKTSLKYIPGLDAPMVRTPMAEGDLVPLDLADLIAFDLLRKNPDKLLKCAEKSPEWLKKEFYGGKTIYEILCDGDAVRDEAVVGSLEFPEAARAKVLTGRRITMMIAEHFFLTWEPLHEGELILDRDAPFWHAVFGNQQPLGYSVVRMCEDSTLEIQKQEGVQEMNAVFLSTVSLMDVINASIIRYSEAWKMNEGDYV